jgi:SAM-dependent methyltransferase
MQNINYNHSQNLHTLDAPSVIFPIINNTYKPRSILDVGCGLGTWLKVASNYGIEDFFGIDGIEVSDEDFFISKEKFKQQNLTEYWDLGRKFDLILCLEVAEHLPSDSSANLIHSLTNNSDTIVFSAACPHQPGQGHINCQWIEYWQNLFNKNGYACFDEIRPVVWNENFSEWWYKQNIFIARKDEVNAGKEARIISMIHPDLYKGYVRESELLDLIACGNSNPKMYIKLLLMSVRKKYLAKSISNYYNTKSSHG